MPARVLVVDDVATNVKLLEAKLSSQYFNVLTATDGQQALDMVVTKDPDIVLLDVMMPGMDGFEVCRQIKGNTETAHIPVIMVTALRHPEDRVAGLDAGADDFLSKPLDDIALFARVKSLVRLKMLTDELRLRQATGKQLGATGGSFVDETEMVNDAKMLLVENDVGEAQRILQSLESLGSLTIEPNADKVPGLLEAGDFDLAIVGLEGEDEEGFRLASSLMSADTTRTIPQIMIFDETDRDGLVKGLELGISDYILRPLDYNEMVARARTQIRRKRYSDRLRDSYAQSLTMAVTDPLTGLYNRRYMSEHLNGLMKSNAETGKTVTLLVADVDHFKDINDRYGHIAGDEVLKEISRRIAANIRGLDLACRYGGEEFVIIMPDADPDFAGATAERLREAIAEASFSVEGVSGGLHVTTSIGYAASAAGLSDPDRLFERADAALYQAKDEGRNRVKAAA